VLDDLRRHLKLYKSKTSHDGYLFPGRWGRGHLHEDYAALIFRKGWQWVDIEGASTHSCRRTDLTLMHRNGVPLRVIQEIRGHCSLEQLQRYLEVESDQIRGAIAMLSMLTPVETQGSGEASPDSEQYQTF
jgi:integrase/recombinase XerD